jgi:hypothetical protein
VGLKLNGKHQLLACVDVVNRLGNNIETIKKDTDTVIDAIKQVDVEANVEKTKYMLVSSHQNEGPNRDKQIANRTFEHVPQFKYLGTTVN